MERKKHFIIKYGTKPLRSHVNTIHIHRTNITNDITLQQFHYMVVKLPIPINNVSTNTSPLSLNILNKHTAPTSNPILDSLTNTKDNNHTNLNKQKCVSFNLKKNTIRWLLPTSNNELLSSSTVLVANKNNNIIVPILKKLNKEDSESSFWNGTLNEEGPPVQLTQFTIIIKPHLFTALNKHLSLNDVGYEYQLEFIQRLKTLKWYPYIKNILQLNTKGTNKYKIQIGVNDTNIKEFKVSISNININVNLALEANIKSLTKRFIPIQESFSFGPICWYDRQGNLIELKDVLVYNQVLVHQNHTYPPHMRPELQQSTSKTKVIYGMYGFKYTGPSYTDLNAFEFLIPNYDNRYFKMNSIQFESISV